MRKLSFDRFEGKFGIFVDDDEALFAIPTKELPKSLKEGDIVKITDEGTLLFDEEATLEEKQKIQKLEEQVFM